MKGKNEMKENWQSNGIVENFVAFLISSQSIFSVVLNQQLRNYIFLRES